MYYNPNYRPREIKDKDLAGFHSCEKCNATGKWPTQKNPEGKCFSCKGTGRILFKVMSEAQIKFIRSLFKQLVSLQDKADKIPALPWALLANDESLIEELELSFFSKEEQDEMIAIMKSHIALEFQLSSRWASNKIEEYKDRIKRYQVALEKALR